MRKIAPSPDNSQGGSGVVPDASRSCKSTRLLNRRTSRLEVKGLWKNPFGAAGLLSGSLEPKVCAMRGHSSAERPCDVNRCDGFCKACTCRRHRHAGHNVEVPRVTRLFPCFCCESPAEPPDRSIRLDGSSGTYPGTHVQIAAADDNQRQADDCVSSLADQPPRTASLIIAMPRKRAPLIFWRT
ncbi:hypothetical protein SAMN06265795_113106 [Noviherbaspirillum humi]|uniref:Uncharacterized protein n=1 Tax=Noviherbaspirillum humi TaxID=1688639 RepID=A0A239JTX8_9BURK|nr:hypothetical protein SAMN06265795_113106 [Noviherbaspirillum humi]